MAEKYENNVGKENRFEFNGTLKSLKFLFISFLLLFFRIIKFSLTILEVLYDDIFI